MLNAGLWSVQDASLTDSPATHCWVFPLALVPIVYPTLTELLQFVAQLDKGGNSVLPLRGSQLVEKGL